MKGRRLIAAGLILIALAVLLAGYNVFCSVRGGNAAEDILAGLDKVTESPEPAPSYMLNPDMEMPEVEIDGIMYIGKVSLPSIGITLPVASSFDNSVLNISPCRYSGSAYRDSMIICGHNFRTHFGFLARVTAGDRVTFTDTEGNVFTYEVCDMESMDGTDVERMSQGDWDLTLFTCTPGGRARLAVRCIRDK